MWDDGQALTACCNGQVTLYGNSCKVMNDLAVDLSYGRITCTGKYLLEDVARTVLTWMSNSTILHTSSHFIVQQMFTSSSCSFKRRWGGKNVDRWQYDC